MGTKQFDSATDLITFTRASGGTALRKVSYGNELVTNGDFASGTTGWVDGTTYSGALDASSGKLLITSDSSNGYGCAIQGVPLVVGKAYRLTGSRRAVSGGNPAIGVSNSAGTVQVVLLSGSASTVTNDFSVTFVASSTLSLCLFNQSPTNGNSSEFDNISVKEALYDQPDGTLQLFNSPANVPRIEYNADGTVKGLLIEEARTNLMTNSGNLASADWSSPRLTVGAVTAGSPFGAYQSITPVGQGVVKANAYQVDKSITLGATYVGWAFVKYSAGSGWFALNLYDTGKDDERAWFDVQNGVVGAKDALIIDHGMVDYGDGWWLCWASANAASGSGGLVVVVTNGNSVVTSSISDTILIAGTQFEAGAFPTSYIPTTGSTATRAADFAQIPTSAFGYNNDKGSLVIDVLTPVADQFMGLAVFNTVNYHNSRGLWKSNFSYNGAGDYFFFQTFDGVSLKVPLGQQTQAGYTKLGLSYGDNENAVKDGGTVISGARRYTNPIRLILGGRDDGYQSQCWIKSIKYYPRRLSNAQLQELTT